MKPDGATPDYRAVILGAGPGLRSDLPTAMVPIGNHGRLLDWLLEAFAHLPGLRVDFVSGFKAHEIIRQYGDIAFHHNPNWRVTGPLRSLSLAPLSSRLGTFICYSDVVFRADSVRDMQVDDADMVVAIDRKWKERYDGRSSAEMDGAEKVRLVDGALVECGRGISFDGADGEFAGLIKLAPSTAARLENVLGSRLFEDRDGLPEVLNFLIKHQTLASTVDVGGEWAELNAPQDLARFVLGTKAESLERLRPLLKSGQIGDLLRFDHRRWLTEPDNVIAKIRGTFGDETVIARSSSLGEDGWRQSSAGAFLSIPDLDTADTDGLHHAIDQVFGSYEAERPDNQILVQRMLEDVRMSGVVMTRTHGHGAPYFVVSYDDTTSRTDTVTSGTGGEVKTLFLHRGRQLRADAAPELAQVLDAVHEVEHLVGHDSLDIEFAVTRDGLVHVLQVRPIAVSHDSAPGHDAAITTGLRHATSYFEELQAPPPSLVGDHTLLSVMSDWNPAEIVGTKPGRLALSLYRHVITDDTWARQRAEYGYRDVRPCPLLVDILGHPYVDVRACFNSFIPAELDDELARRLVEHHLAHLAQSPELHDKVEFDILFTCWTFDIEKRIQRLAAAGFTADDQRALMRALSDVTRRGIERCRGDYEALQAVARRHASIAASTVSPLHKTYLYLDNAARYGTLHFAHLARGAFVATSLLRSLVETEDLEVAELEAFLSSVNTVSTAIQRDAGRAARNDISWEEFVGEYGHLRPGTYDINSSRYDAAPEEFLRPIVEQTVTEVEAPPFAWAEATKTRFESALQRAGLGISLPAFDEFLRLSIEGREYGKFIFSRDLSAAIECLAEFGAAHFVLREELSHVDLRDLLRFLSVGTDSPSVALHELARSGLETYRIHQSICLPDQILSAEDLTCFELRKVTPNYVTRKKVRATVVCVDQSTSPDVDLAGRIVLIPNADPGFDWIFSRGIAGLITKYGGANSHMAVRMAEFQLPGVTGVGELLFDQLSQAKTVELDCAGRQVRTSYG